MSDPGSGRVRTHGASGYNKGCRCDLCRLAQAARKRARLERLKSAGLPPDLVHGLNAYMNWGCRCEDCRAGVAERNAGQYAYQREHWKRRQRASQAAATRSGLQWTGPELEVASRTDLSARDVAALLGRTVAAVQNIRQQLKRDPRYIESAGISVRAEAYANADIERIEPKE